MRDETEKPMTLSDHGNSEVRRIAQEEAAKLLRLYQPSHRRSQRIASESLVEQEEDANLLRQCEAFTEFQKAKAYCLMHQPEGIALCVKVGDVVFRFLLDDESGRFFAVTLGQHYKLFQSDGLDGSPVSEPLGADLNINKNCRERWSEQTRSNIVFVAQQFGPKASVAIWQELGDSEFASAASEMRRMLASNASPSKPPGSLKPRKTLKQDVGLP